MKNHSLNNNDTINVLNIKYLDGEGFVALDPQGKRLFTVYPFDNGPDYASEGLFRILEKDKIGFANLRGKIVIKPQFTAVFPFHGNLAAFCEGCVEVRHGEHKSWQKGLWGFIDQHGNKIIPAQYDKIIEDFSAGYALVEKDSKQFRIDKKGDMIKSEEMNYREWLRIFADVTRLINKVHFEDALVIELHWNTTGKVFLFANKEPNALKINIFSKADKKLLVSYVLIPWQNFSINTDQDDLNNIGLIDELITVTDYALTYRSFSTAHLNGTENKTLEIFHKAFRKIIHYDNNQEIVKDENFDFPENMQIISSNIFQNYFDLQVAIPGSTLPEPDRLTQVSKNKMLKLNLIPDKGPIKTNWFKPANLSMSVYYTSVEKELLDLFSEAVATSIKNPDQREEIYKTTKDKMRELFSAANSYVNFLYAKYESRLKRWLLLPEQKAEETTIENTFPDYEPKRTPDTALDFMPELGEEYFKIPEAQLENIKALLDLFFDYQNRAKINPGKWVEGNVILGAKPQEYQPTQDELLLAVVGDRINDIFKAHPQANVQNHLTQKDAKPSQLEYTLFTFTHADVMGSGRFFYVDTIEKVIINFK